MGKALTLWFVFLSSVCFAQIASISRLQTAGGFLEVCGPEVTQLSKEQGETVQKAPPSQVLEVCRKPCRIALLKRPCASATWQG